MKLIIINGPNLNLTGEREPSVYGNRTFTELLDLLRLKYPSHQLEYFQSNIEGEIIDALQATRKTFDGIILNAGGYTHTSVAIGDTVRAIGIPVVEVHLSNVFSRESYRHQSFIAPAARGVIGGFGMDSYRLAVESFLGGGV